MLLPLTMRVVIDTNVLLSGLIRPQGAPGAIVRALRDGRIVPIFTRPMLEELAAVLSRPWLQDKYGLDQAAVETARPGDKDLLRPLPRLG